MGRLFAGTPWDRPPTCDRCGRLESECACTQAVGAPARMAPQQQTARVGLRKRPQGKVVTIVNGLSADGNDLTTLASQLKERCATGGTVKDGAIELQGDHVAAVERALAAFGYQTRRG